MKKINSVQSIQFSILGIDLCWWGLSQLYKWRWNNTHIDLGPLSIYNLPQEGPGRMFWESVAFLVKPLRWYYNKYHVTSPEDYKKFLNKLGKDL